MGLPSDRRFLAVARIRLRHLFPRIPGQSGYHKRRLRLAETIEWLGGVFARQGPGAHDDLLLPALDPGRGRRLRLLPQPRPLLAGHAPRAWSALPTGPRGRQGPCRAPPFGAAAGRMGAVLVRPVRRDEAGAPLRLAPIRQRIESVFWTCKDILSFERHGARTIEGLCERIGSRVLALAACISLNHRLGRPSRALVDYVA